ncbi:SusC/RagA family TonB-linked outer membrane protein [Mucilaginibacter terrae]|uniref:TonB-linked SusC/RagA family outer membrane protein n=1 Tax=Mucilaginibacter terrae TaxID=1955052 RepID=A0ABU3GV92_9SPHI|nr:TonB-dependent receptor [Mucilaginibacter terrae]MDT3403585.1 TonB-linked SusC/RagA family outer membrane protein [Mucilaginibacter terrae]
MRRRNLLHLFQLHQTVNIKKMILVPLALSAMLSPGYAVVKDSRSLTSNTQRADVQVTGIVKAASGEPLPGVSVSIKGGGRSTVTDVNGKYSITAPENSTLVFNYIGFTAQEVIVGSNPTINITLQPSNNSLEDVVVIGYQSVRRKDLTGASGSVNTANTQKLVSRSLPETLQGQVPGVSVRTGGAPGQEAVVNIRGLATFGNANPLYVIDGMIGDPNTTINPNDIEDVQILKDASAAAIYGSRAGNGVILITTKKGKEGPAKINVTARYSISKVPKTYDMMNAAEYAATNTRAYQASGTAIQPGVANYNGRINTNWVDETLRTGYVQDYNANISGGGNGSRYLISAGYFKDKGVLIAREFERASFRVNTETTKGRFKFGENIALSSSNLRSPFEGGAFAGNPWYDMFSSVPLIPVQDNALISTNNPGGWGYGSNANINTFSRNPVAVANITSVRSNFAKILGNAYVDFKIIDGLTYRFNLGLETSFDKSKSIRKEGSWYQNQSPDFSQLSDNRSQYLSYLLEHTLNYNYNVGKHSINGVVGYTQQTTQTDNTLGSGINLAQFGGEYFNTLTSTAGAGRNSSGTLYKNFLDSYLGRLNYTYADKYLLTFTFRADKDSRFSPQYRTGYFPSAALAWRISKEDFFKVDWISDLKLRGSYGALGVNTLSAYQYIGFLNQAPDVVLGSGQVTNPGAIQAKLASGDLRWEKKKTTNIGFDAAMFNNQFVVNFDIFRSISKDVLLSQPLPGYLGNLQGDPIVNIGSIQNQGVELNLAYRPKLSGAFRWDIAGNISVIRNKVLSLGNLGIDTETGQPKDYIQSGNTRTQVGRSIGEYFVLKTDGIFQSQAEINAHGAQSAYAKPGDIRYVNTVNGGTNDDINDKDRVFAGSAFPKFTSGLQFNSGYKNFTLSLQFYGAFGQKLYNDVIRDLDSYGNSNYRRAINPWTPTNTDTSYPRLGYQFAANDRGINENARGNSDRWIENGSYLRLRNLELGYNLPNKWLSKAGISNARIYLSGQNLFTITKYKGLDPDVVGANANLEPGVDNGNYPSSRIVSFGLGIGF